MLRTRLEYTDAEDVSMEADLRCRKSSLTEIDFSPVRNNYGVLTPKKHEFELAAI